MLLAVEVAGTRCLVHASLSAVLNVTISHFLAVVWPSFAMTVHSVGRISSLSLSLTLQYHRSSFPAGGGGGGGALLFHPLLGAFSLFLDAVKSVSQSVTICACPFPLKFGAHMVVVLSSTPARLLPATTSTTNTAPQRPHALRADSYTALNVTCAHKCYYHHLLW